MRNESTTLIFWLMFSLGVTLFVGFLSLFLLKGSLADSTIYDEYFRNPQEAWIGFASGPVFVLISAFFRKAAIR